MDEHHEIFTKLVAFARHNNLGCGFEDDDEASRFYVSYEYDGQEAEIIKLAKQIKQSHQNVQFLRRGRDKKRGKYLIFDLINSCTPKES